MSKKTSNAIAVVPEIDFKEVQRDLTPLLKIPTIKNDTQYEKARENYKLIGEIEKELKTKEDDILNPINQSVKRIKALFKPHKDQIKALDQSWGESLNAYVNARESARIQASEAINSDKRLSNPATIQNKLNEIESRASGTMKIRTLQIHEPAKVPDEFWIIDEVKLRAALVAGQEVPGASLIESLTVTKR